MSNPPDHRKNSFMSWMADMPDDFLEEEERREIMQARKNFGAKVVEKKEVPIDGPLRVCTGHKRL